MMNNLELNIDTHKLPSINDGYYEVIDNRLMLIYSDKKVLEFEFKIHSEYFMLDILTDCVDIYFYSTNFFNYRTNLLGDIIRQMPVPLLVNNYYVPSPEISEELKFELECHFRKRKGYEKFKGFGSNSIRFRLAAYRLIDEAFREHPLVKCDPKWQEHFACHSYHSDGWSWMSRRIQRIIGLNFTDRCGATISFQDAKKLKDGFLIHSHDTL